MSNAALIGTHNNLECYSMKQKSPITAADAGYIGTKMLVDAKQSLLTIWWCESVWQLRRHLRASVNPSTCPSVGPHATTLHVLEFLPSVSFGNKRDLHGNKQTWVRINAKSYKATMHSVMIGLCVCRCVGVCLSVKIILLLHGTTILNEPDYLVIHIKRTKHDKQTDRSSSAFALQILWNSVSPCSVDTARTEINSTSFASHQLAMCKLRSCLVQIYKKVEYMTTSQARS